MEKRGFPGLIKVTREGIRFFLEKRKIKFILINYIIKSLIVHFEIQKDFSIQNFSYSFQLANQNFLFKFLDFLKKLNV